MLTRRCRTCKEQLLETNFTISNGYIRRDCKECYNDKQKEKRKTNGTAKKDSEWGLLPDVRDLQKTISELEEEICSLEQECNDLNNEIIKLKE